MNKASQTSMLKKDMLFSSFFFFDKRIISLIEKECSEKADKAHEKNYLKLTFSSLCISFPVHNNGGIRQQLNTLENLVSSIKMENLSFGRDAKQQPSQLNKASQTSTLKKDMLFIYLFWIKENIIIRERSTKKADKKFT